MTFDLSLLPAIAAALLAGLVRGFSGFGGALVFMPVASAALGARTAAPVFLVIDFLLTLPMAFPAARACRWRTVAPAVAAALVTAPAGAAVLAAGDPLALRWAIAVVVIGLLALLVSGWRYQGEPKVPVSLGVGAVSGFLGGFGQVSGPPVIAYWVSGPYRIDVIRANMFVFFALISLSSFAAYLWQGLFNGATLRATLIVAPVYAAALFAGGRLFRATGGAAYRPVAYAVIALAALTSMPVFDGLLR